jgi:hypothetical protein
MCLRAGSRRSRLGDPAHILSSVRTFFPRQEGTLPPALNLEGQQFGRWKVTGISHRNKRGAIFWSCICEGCGTTKSVLGSALTRRGTLGCAKCAGADRRTHGRSKELAYKRWLSMKDRCGNPRSKSWRWYGRLGIEVCAEWRDSFEALYRDVGPPPTPRHQIERRNPFVSYTPRNTIWATPEQQARNRRNSRRRSPEEKLWIASGWWAELVCRYAATGNPLPPTAGGPK